MEQSILNFEYYIDLAKEGKSYDEIRRLLVNEGHNDEAIAQVMRIVDRHIIINVNKNTKAKSGKNLKLMGAVLFFLGIIMTVYYSSKVGSSYILPYGSILTGVGMFLKGRSMSEK